MIKYFDLFSSARSKEPDHLASAPPNPNDPSDPGGQAADPQPGRKWRADAADQATSGGERSFRFWRAVGQATADGGKWTERLSVGRSAGDHHFFHWIRSARNTAVGGRCHPSPVST